MYTTNYFFSPPFRAALDSFSETKCLLLGIGMGSFLERLKKEVKVE